MCRVASTPLIVGMFRSMTTTSGASSRTSLTASAPFAASPSTCTPPCSSSRLRRPVRKRSWSSTSRTRSSSWAGCRPALSLMSPPCAAILVAKVTWKVIVTVRVKAAASAAGRDPDVDAGCPGSRRRCRRRRLRRSPGSSSACRAGSRSGRWRRCPGRPGGRSRSCPSGSSRSRSTVMDVPAACRGTRRRPVRRRSRRRVESRLGGRRRRLGRGGVGGRRASLAAVAVVDAGRVRGLGGRLRWCTCPAPSAARLGAAACAWSVGRSARRSAPAPAAATRGRQVRSDRACSRSAASPRDAVAGDLRLPRPGPRASPGPA